jgi:hypothetical protein
MIQTWNQEDGRGRHASPHLHQSLLVEAPHLLWHKRGRFCVPARLPNFQLTCDAMGAYDEDTAWTRTTELNLLIAERACPF